MSFGFMKEPPQAFCRNCGQPNTDHNDEICRRSMFGNLVSEDDWQRQYDDLSEPLKKPVRIHVSKPPKLTYEQAEKKITDVLLSEPVFIKYIPTRFAFSLARRIIHALF